MSEFPRVFKKVACTGVAALSLAACTPKPHGETTPTTAPVTTAAPETTTTELTTLNYMESTARNQRFDTAIHEMGAKILSASQHNTNWGRFDVYCSSNNGVVSGTGGWKSEGYKEKPGESCVVEHNRGYHGSSDSISTTDIVPADGKYTDSDSFVAVTVDTANCQEVNASYNPLTKYWGSWYQPNNDTNSIDSGSAKTAEQAQAIDDHVMLCLENAVASTVFYK